MRPECIDQGCADKFKENKEGISCIKNKRLPELHEKVNARPTWRFVLWALGIGFILISGSYSYTLLTGSEVRAEIKEVKGTMVTQERVDRMEDNLLYELRKLREDRRHGSN